MDVRHSNPARSFNGCWTCRLRRKKCDEKSPVCETCATLHISCYYGRDKPSWMDGGAQQEEMAERLKREVKEKAHIRREERAGALPVDNASATEATPGNSMVKCLPSPICALSLESEMNNSGVEPGGGGAGRRGVDCTLLSKDARENIVLGESDTTLLMFYLDYLLPFQFPFYRPPVLEGGKGWILEMMLRSPVIRQTAFCQSSYFFSLARGNVDSNVIWEAVLARTREAFDMLRQALQIIVGAGVAEHLHGAVRILASIMQVQRFEIAVLSFDNCRSHLNAALTVFKELLESTGPGVLGAGRTNFSTLLNLLGPSLPVSPVQSMQVPSAEHAAMRFSSALLLLDDIVASTVLQQRPELYEYHQGLLDDSNGIDPVLDMEAVIGCQNWVLLAIGEIAVLDAWKQQCKQDGNLDVMELVRRASCINSVLKARLEHLENSTATAPTESNSLLNVFAAEYSRLTNRYPSQSSLVTRIWAHAALIYLFVVVSGWQPACTDVRYHVGQIIELLTHQVSPPALLRTMVWPFCVAGCLAQPAQEAQLRSMVEALQPPSVFGTVRKALEIMENVWRQREAGNAASRDLAMYFRSQGELVLLV